MKPDEVMALTDIELNEVSLKLLGDAGRMEFFIEHGWDPTHDIAAAWELVNAAKDVEYWMSAEYKLVYGEFIDYEAGWEVLFRGVGVENSGKTDFPERHFAIGDTMPCAITRAFILAMEPE